MNEIRENFHVSDMSVGSKAGLSDLHHSYTAARNGKRKSHGFCIGVFQRPCPHQPFPSVGISKRIFFTRFSKRCYLYRLRSDYSGNIDPFQQQIHKQFRVVIKISQGHIVGFLHRKEQGVALIAIRQMSVGRQFSVFHFFGVKNIPFTVFFLRDKTRERRIIIGMEYDVCPGPIREDMVSVFNEEGFQ